MVFFVMSDVENLSSLLEKIYFIIVKYTNCQYKCYNLFTDSDWELVFRAQAYNNLSPYNAWMGTLSLPTPAEDGCRLMTNTSTCTTIYRSGILDLWESESLSEVQLEMYKDGQRVVNIRFDGIGSTIDDWFDISRLIDSGWSKLNKNSTFNFFELRGAGERTFYMNQRFRGCALDRGWMMVADVNATARWFCDYDNNHTGFPAFLYAPGEDVMLWQDPTFDYGLADVLAVFIKN
ncbi:uncharacterized protein [Argopecten irradians]|uniref:uncharacterized protein n=1 Tax=Argopecten irradians TaxID=31199 RepID=UPI003720E54D